MGASFPLAIASVAVAGQDPAVLWEGCILQYNRRHRGSLGFSLFIIPQFGTQIAGRLLILAAAAAAFIALVASVSFQRRGRAETSSPYKLSFSDLVLTTVSLLAVALMVDAVPRIPWMMVAWGRLSATYMAQAAPEIIREGEEQPEGAAPRAGIARIWAKE
jgi:hypothetical protein